MALRERVHTTNKKDPIRPPTALTDPSPPREPLLPPETYDLHVSSAEAVAADEALSGPPMTLGSAAAARVKLIVCAANDRRYVTSGRSCPPSLWYIFFDIVPAYRAAPIKP
jgi:hypothetical protein